MLCFITDPLLQMGSQKNVYVPNVLSLGIDEKGARRDLLMVG